MLQKKVSCCKKKQFVAKKSSLLQKKVGFCCKKKGFLLQKNMYSNHKDSKANNFHHLLINIIIFKNFISTKSLFTTLKNLKKKVGRQFSPIKKIVSYAGAMSAWFRYKYPHLTVGALASSAVIHPILNFTKFDE